MHKYIASTRIKINRYFNMFFLKGENVVCEMCNWHGKRFPNNRCPKCNSYARTRLIPFSLDFFKIPRKDISLLHVAPNISEYNFILDNFNCTKYDRLNIVGAKNINLVEDITNTSIPDNEYDLILIWHVLEHIPNDHDAILEIYRILKTNGKLLVSVPIYPAKSTKTYEDFNLDRSQYENIHGHYDHCRSCGLDYYERFEKSGFKTKTLHVEDLEDNVINKFGLSKNHTVWFFEK